MHPDHLARYFVLRRQGIARIGAVIEHHKMCLNCLSISLRRAPVCPTCKSYRFTEDRIVMQVVLKNMWTRPFPVLAATGPRLAEFYEEQNTGAYEKGRPCESIERHC